MRRYLAFALLAFSIPAHADKIDDVIKQEMARQHIPGVALLITKNDKPIKTAAYGSADMELGVKMKPDMIFESGSIGKCFTATIILQLWEQGKIGLDDPLSKYIDNAPETWKAITIRNLLGHTSGIADYALVEGLGLAGHWTTEEWFTKMATVPMDFPTGRQWAYSNSNYLLLGLIAQKITGTPITTLVHDRIFKVLGMDHSYLADDSAIVPGRVSGYWPGEHGMINEIRIISGYGDGSEMNSCEDLAKFERGIREGKLLKPETVAMMQTSGKLANGRKTGYGFAWFVRKVYGHPFISHGGNTGGFGSSMTRVPERNLTIIVMTNQANVSGDGLAQKIAMAYDPSLMPKPQVESPDPDAALSAKLREALEGLAKGDTKQPIFDDDYLATLATGRGQMALPSYVPFRDIKSFAYCSTEADDPDTVLRYRVKTKDHSYIVGFWVTKEGKIYAVAVRPEA